MRICTACGHEWDHAPPCDACGWAPGLNGTIELHAPGVGPDEGYEPAHFTELARLESAHFWFRRRNQIILDVARRHFPDTAAYLEVGCGTGYVLGMFAERHPEWTTWGSELHVEGLEFAAARAPRARFLQMDARHIPFRSEFDLVGSFDVLEHIEEDEQVLAAMHSALKPGGGLLLTVPQHPWLWSSQDDAAHHVRRYRRGELEDKLRKAGFQIVRTSSFVTLLLPVMLLSRVANRMSAAARLDPLREFRIGPLANRIGSAAMALDRALLRAGIDLPFGGSRIIAARRPG